MIIINQKRALKALDLALKSRMAVILVGPAGSGKTLLAQYYAGSNARILHCPTEIGDSDALIEELLTDEVNLIVDEIHKLRDFENLYPVIDSHKLLIAGTTTDEGLLPDPLLSRMLTVSIEPYSLVDLASIATTVTPISWPVAIELAKYAHGNPRRVITFARLASAMGGEVTDAQDFLHSINFDLGFTYKERQFLIYLSEHEILSLNTLARLLKTGKETVIAMEGLLIGEGLVEIAPRGRMITPKGRDVANSLKA